MPSTHAGTPGQARRPPGTRGSPRGLQAGNFQVSAGLVPPAAVWEQDRSPRRAFQERSSLPMSPTPSPSRSKTSLQLLLVVVLTATAVWAGWQVFLAGPETPGPPELGGGDGPARSPAEEGREDASGPGLDPPRGITPQRAEGRDTEGGAPVRPAGNQAAERLQALRSGRARAFLEVQVTDPDGAPAAGAEVVAFDARGTTVATPGRRLQAGETDDEGRYRSREPLHPGQRLALLIRHPEAAPQWIFDVDPLFPESLRVHVALEPGRALQGRVRAESGPVGGALVAARSVSGPVPARLAVVRETRSAPDGTFRLTGLAPGSLEVQVAAPGFAAVRRQVRLAPRGEEPRLAVTLAPAAGLRGRVVAAGDGSGVAEARVRLVPAGGDAARGAPCELTTAADGTFSAQGLLHQPYRLEVEAPGFAPSGYETVRPGTEEVRVRLEARSVLEGRVLDGGGAPLEGATVVAGAWRGPREVAWDSGAVTTGEGGRFLLPAVSPGTVWVYARAPGWTAGRVGPLEIARGERREGLVIQLQAGAVVTGRLEARDGRPLGGRPVTLGRYFSTRTVRDAVASRWGLPQGELGGADLGEAREGLHAAGRTVTFPDGSFVFPAVGPGDYVVVAPGDATYAEARSQRFALTGPGRMELAALRTERCGGLRGQVLDGAGKPEPAALVLVRGEGAEMVRRTAPTGPGGRFQLTGLPPGTYHVKVVRRRGRVVPEALGGRSPDGMEVVVEPGETAEVRLEEP